MVELGLSTIVFTIAPAISILLGVVTLSKFLGIPLPWIRMSVIGVITYELPAATSTAKAFGISLVETITDPKVYIRYCLGYDTGNYTKYYFTADSDEKDSKRCS